MVVPSKNKAFKCKLIDAENVLFQCEKTSIPYDSLNMDQQICSSVKQTQDIISWVKEVKKKWEDSDCSKSINKEVPQYGP